MRINLLRPSAVLICLFMIATPRLRAAEADAPLPDGVKAVWDLPNVWRQSTPTRERICINGLWRWQPAHANAATIPAEGFGYFKVPGCWPGITDYMQKDSQAVYRHPH